MRAFLKKKIKGGKKPQVGSKLPRRLALLQLYKRQD